jgi:hypothetical protein
MRLGSFLGVASHYWQSPLRGIEVHVQPFVHCSGLIEGLGLSIESLVGRSPLRDIIVRSCKVGTRRSRSSFNRSVKNSQSGRRDLFGTSDAGPGP